MGVIIPLVDKSSIDRSKKDLSVEEFSGLLADNGVKLSDLNIPPLNPDVEYIRGFYDVSLTPGVGMLTICGAYNYSPLDEMDLNPKHNGVMWFNYVHRLFKE